MSTTTAPQPSVTVAGGSLPTHIRRTRKVALIGFGATARDCPWQDESWELWGMNGFWRAAKADYGVEAPEERYSLWFDMHSRDYIEAYGKAAGVGDKQQEWLKQEHQFPIFMLEEHEEFPSVLAFPLELVVKMTGRDYFTSTVAYMLAFALAQADVAEVGLWGVDLVHSTEYEHQRPCAEYWIGRLEAAGITVTIHPDSALLNGRTRYGYEDTNPLLKELRAHLQMQAASVEKAVAKNREEQERLVAQMHTDDGAHQMIRGLLDRLDIWERGGRI